MSAEPRHAGETSTWDAPFARRLQVRGRIVAAILVPVGALVVAMSALVAVQHEDVRTAQDVTEDARVLEQLAELRSALFAERIAAEILLPSHRPRDDLLEDTVLGSVIVDGVEPLVARTDAALAGLGPADRPFARERLDAARAGASSWVTVGDVRAALGTFEDLVRGALADRGRSTRDAAVEIGDAELIEAGTALQHSVAIPVAAGEVVASLADLWLAPAADRLSGQSAVAAAAAELARAARALEQVTGRHTVSWAGLTPAPLPAPDELRLAVEGALRGDLTGPARPPGEPTELEGVLLRGTDWVLAVDDLPIHGARVLATNAERLETTTAGRQRDLLLLGLAVLLLSLIGALVLARSIIAPVRRLTDRARLVGAGDIGVEPLPLRGPPDVVEATAAVNDVVGTLDLLERKTLALADLDLGAPVMAQPLPGRLGASLQRSVEVLSRSVVDREELREQLVYEATHDPLTGLANRTALVPHMEALAADGCAFSLVFVDLQDFKATNDRHGHAVGDEVLRVIATRLGALAGEDSFVARSGGDEFVLVLSGISEADAAVALASAVVDGLLRPIEVEGLTVRVIPRAGVAVADASADRSLAPLSLLHRADLAVRHGADDRTSRVAVYDEELDRRLAAEDDVAEALSDAIGRGDQLHLLYQPIVSASEGTLCEVEALVRWDRPDHGRIAPDGFIPIAERSALIVRLDDWVLHAALAQLDRWSQVPSLQDLPIGVNVSGRTLLDPRFSERVARALTSSAIPPERLKVEVTETAALTDLELASSQLATLRALGVKVVIDDFGTGYTSVAHLRSLTIDELKIDGSFVRALARPADRVLVEMINQVAHLFGVPTVAEGVETQAQLEVLREIGCDLVQGYLVARPMEPVALAGWAEDQPAASP